MMTKPSYLPLQRKSEVADFLPLPCKNASSLPQYPIVLYTADCQTVPFPSSIHPSPALIPHPPLPGAPGLTILPPQRIYPQPIADLEPRITEIQYLPYPACNSRNQRLRTWIGSHVKSLLQLALGVIAGIALVKIPSWFLPSPPIAPMLGELPNNPQLKGAFSVSGLVGESPATVIGIGGTLEGTLTAQGGHFQASVGPTPAMAPVAMDRFYLAPNTSLSSNQVGAMNSMVVVDRFYFPNPSDPVTVSREFPSPTLPMLPGADPARTLELSPSATDNGLASADATGSDTYILAGVMELGNQSTALFHQGDQTYSVRLGEKIGASDWVLTSITAGRALLNYGGETRLLRVGEAL